MVESLERRRRKYSGRFVGMNPNSMKHIILLSVFLVVFIWSAVHPKDRVVWLLEVFPAIAGVALAVIFYKSFKFTNLAYLLILAHSVVLMIGGHYTYSEMPLFNYLKDEFGLLRNHYDRVGHFFQGFAPAIITREILIRKSPLTHGGWLFFTVLSIVLSISALYEIFEWWVAVLSEGSKEAFLAMQGDVWDTQWDMFLALFGGFLSLVTLRGFHDKELNELKALKLF